MKQISRFLLLIITIALFLSACATTKQGTQITKDKKATQETETSQKETKSDAKVDTTLSDKEKKQAPNKEKSLNVRKMSQKEVVEREKRFDGQVYVGKAKKEFQNGLESYFKTDCNKAILYWKNGLEDDQYAAPLAFNIALCLEREGKKSEAKKWYSKSFSMDNNYVHPLYNLFLLTKKTEKVSLASFEELASQIPEPVYRYNFLAWIYYQQKQYPSAEEYARKVLKIDEQNSDAVVVLASVYFKQGMLELARAALETASKWNSDDFRLQRLYGFVLYKLKKTAPAITHLQKAKKLNPELPGVLNLLAVLSFTIGDWETAKQNLEFLLAFNPHFFPAKLNLGIVYKELKEYKKSVSLFNELEKLSTLSDEDKYKLYYNLGVLHLDTDIAQTQKPERFDTATSYFQKSLAALKGKKGIDKKQKLLQTYIKESKIEKRKLTIYLKAKVKREQRRKEREKEAEEYVALRKTKFAEAETTNTIIAWQTFIEKYPPDIPNDELEKKAKENLAALDNALKAEMEQEQAVLVARKGAFDAAKQNDKIALWQKFIAEFPSPTEKDDEMIIRAKARVEFLQQQAEKRKNELDQYVKDRDRGFDQAKKGDSLSSWQNFLQRFPSPTEGTDDQKARFAKEQILHIQTQLDAKKTKEEECKKQRKHIFTLAKQQRNVAAWQDFMKNFPPCLGGEDTMFYYAKMQITTLQKQAQEKKNSDYLNERKNAFNAVKKIDDSGVYLQFSGDFPPLNGKEDAVSRYIKKRMKELQKQKDAQYLEERSAAFNAVKKIDDPRVYLQFSRDFPPLNGKEDAISQYVKKRLKVLQKKK